MESCPVQKIILKNNVTLLLEKTTNTKSTSVGFYINKGSLNESDNQFGWSHFCEHMIFKGTKNYTNKQLTSIFDNMGGYINAATTYNKVFIYNKVPHFYSSECIDMIIEMYNNATFDAKEMESEREVILNEMRMGEEEPQSKIMDVFMNNIFANSPMGHAIIGTEESIKKVTQQELFDFYQQMFVAENLTVSIVGNFNQDEIIAKFNNVEFRHSEKIKTPEIKPTLEKHSEWITQPSSQLHIMLGTNIMPNDLEKRYALRVFNSLFGENMSSRLFQKLREEMGLCYSVYSSFTQNKNVCLFYIYLSIDSKNLNKTIAGINNIIKTIKKDGISDEELKQAINQIVCEYVLDYDNLQKRMSRTANSELTFNKYISLDETIEKIKSVTKEQVQNLINTIFVKENFFIEYLFKSEKNTTELDF